MKTIFLFAFLMLSNLMFSQNSGHDVFQRISSEVTNFKVDTIAVPEDQLTVEIRKLRNVKGGFNINEAILYKLGEDRNKGDISPEEAEKIESYFSKGNGKKWLENAVIWIYRSQFSLSEIKELNKFYHSAAGKKLSQNFPIVMMQSLKSAEMIVEKYKSETKK